MMRLAYMVGKESIENYRLNDPENIFGGYGRNTGVVTISEASKAVEELRNLDIIEVIREKYEKELIDEAKSDNYPMRQPARGFMAVFGFTIPPYKVSPAVKDRLRHLLSPWLEGNVDTITTAFERDLYEIGLSPRLIKHRGGKSAHLQLNYKGRDCSIEDSFKNRTTINRLIRMMEQVEDEELAIAALERA